MIVSSLTKQELAKRRMERRYQRKWCAMMTWTYDTASPDERFDVTEEVINSMRCPDEAHFDGVYQMLKQGYTPLQILAGLERPALTQDITQVPLHMGPIDGRA